MDAESRTRGTLAVQARPTCRRRGKTVQHLRLYYWSKLRIHILTRRDHIRALTRGTFARQQMQLCSLSMEECQDSDLWKCHLLDAVTRSSAPHKPIKPNWQDCSNRSDLSDTHTHLHTHLETLSLHGITLQAIPSMFGLFTKCVCVCCLSVSH